MKNKENEYRKLPGTKKGFLIGRYTLWQETDHLLHVYSRFGAENYKRFYLSDIQAVITRKTLAGKIQNTVLGGFILFWVSAAVLTGVPEAVFFAPAAGLFLIFLLVNLFRGPTCETRLQTAVQTEKLHSLHRLKNALRVMDCLQPEIQRVQGALSRENLARIPASRAVKAPSRQTRASQSVRRPEKGRAHLVLFLLLLFEVGLLTSGIFFSHVFVTILNTVTTVSLGICVIIALVRQHGSDISVALRAVTWMSLGYIAVTFAAGYIATMAVAFRNPAIVYNQWEFFKFMSRLSPLENPLLLGIDIFSICGASLLGIAGLLMLPRSGKS